MERNTDRTRAVFSCTYDAENIPLDIYLQIFNRHAGEFDLYDPAVGSLIHIGRRVPQAPRLDLLRRSQKTKMTVE